MDTRKTIGYRIVSCQERSFDAKLRLAEKVSGTDVSFQYGCSISVVTANRLSITIISTILVKGKIGLKLESETIFEFSPFDAVFDISSNGRITDRIGIMPTLFGLSYSSTRGMVAIRTAGTYLESYPLPIVDANDVTRKMMQQA